MSTSSQFYDPLAGGRERQFSPPVTILAKCAMSTAAAATGNRSSSNLLQQQQSFEATSPHCNFQGKQKSLPQRESNIAILWVLFVSDKFLHPQWLEFLARLHRLRPMREKMQVTIFSSISIRNPTGNFSYNGKMSLTQNTHYQRGLCPRSEQVPP